MQGCIYGCRDRDQAEANQKHSESETSNFYVQKRLLIMAFIINYSFPLIGAVKYQVQIDTLGGEV